MFSWTTSDCNMITHATSATSLLQSKLLFLYFLLESVARRRCHQSSSGSRTPFSDEATSSSVNEDAKFWLSDTVYIFLSAVGSQTPLPIDMFIVMVDVSGACLFKADCSTNQLSETSSISSWEEFRFTFIAFLDALNNTKPASACKYKSTSEYTIHLCVEIMVWLSDF